MYSGLSHSADTGNLHQIGANHSSNLKYYFYSQYISKLVVFVKQFDTWKWHMNQLLYAKMHDNLLESSNKKKLNAAVFCFCPS